MPAVQPTKAITAAHRMTDDEVIEAAEAEGFELFWRPIGGKVWVGFVRGDDVPRVRCRAPRDQLHGRLAPARTRVRLTAPERAICAPSPLLAGGIEPRDTDARETERGPPRLKMWETPTHGRSNPRLSHRTEATRWQWVIQSSSQMPASTSTTRFKTHSDGTMEPAPPKVFSHTPQERLRMASA